MSALISAAELATQLQDVVLLDVQFNLVGTPGAQLYAQAHLPGARFVDLDHDLAGPPGLGGRHPLPDAESFATAMRRLGVRSDSAVVAYDQATSLSAARAWWTLRYFGIPNVRVLNGGLAAWRIAGGEVSTEVPDLTPSTFEAAPESLPALDIGDVVAFIDAGGQLLDVRSPERFRGDVEPIDAVAGHIPGARNAPAAGYLEADGHFADRAGLEAYARAAGIGADTAVATSCGSGVTAAQAALALHEIGCQATVFIGSWSQWIADPRRPVSTGPR